MSVPRNKALPHFDSWTSKPHKLIMPIIINKCHTTVGVIIFLPPLCTIKPGLSFFITSFISFMLKLLPRFSLVSRRGDQIADKPPTVESTLAWLNWTLSAHLLKASRWPDRSSVLAVSGAEEGHNACVQWHEQEGVREGLQGKVWQERQVPIKDFRGWI